MAVKVKNQASPASLLFISLIIVIVTKINGHEFTLHEATIEGIQRAFAENRLTSRQVVEFYLNQIETLNPILRSVVEVNPDALDLADEADRRRGRDDLGRSLNGIPVLLKDTIATKDKLNTTAGSYALLGSVVARDAGVVEKLRAAGAVIMGKASLTEWYSFRALGHVPNGCGSAISVAANMVTVSIGSETHGSILCPADHSSVVGFKPTVGLTSRAGVVPVLPPHDTIGTLSRTVSDAVYVIDTIVGYDQRDHEATKEASKFIPLGGYKQFLKLDGLKGKRLGVVRKPFVDTINKPSVLHAFESHLNTLRQKGATIVDNLEIQNVNIVLNPGKSGELVSMLAEFKLSINDYLKELVASPVRSLADIIAFNEKHPDLEKTKEYGQATFISSEKTNGIGEKEIKAAELMKNLSRDGFEKIMVANELDALVTPGTGAISVLALGGYPGITVPAGYDDEGMPFGLCFGGLKGTEPKLIEAAYAFEQATLVRRPPFSRSPKLEDEEGLFGSW
ncbi:Amidase [Trema orientale]|uniref:Amidase n=1 Tax=Trema orientale TaxID=63057 RepID=A0A2P5ED49_TREOI|nr:Amidase [Trema orientale]